jgi:hypothetical protein
MMKNLDLLDGQKFACKNRSAAGWVIAADHSMPDLLFPEEEIRGISYLPNHSL